MFYIRIAELNIKINNKYPRVERLCAEYIIPETDTVDIEVTATESEIEKEVIANGLNINELNMEQLDAIWDRNKENFGKKD